MTSDLIPPDDGQEMGALPEFTADDIPLWLEEKLGDGIPHYVKLRNELVGQVTREAEKWGGWPEIAIQYLDTLANGSPPFGGLHHTLLIIAAALRAPTTPEVSNDPT